MGFSYFPFKCCLCKRVCKNTVDDNGMIDQDVFLCEKCKRVYCYDCQFENQFHEEAENIMTYDFACCEKCCHVCCPCVCSSCGDMFTLSIFDPKYDKDRISYYCEFCEDLAGA